MARGKWIRGKLHGVLLVRDDMQETSYSLGKRADTYGTKLVWNSFRSTFKLPSKRRDAVILETTWAINLFKLVKLGEVTFSFFLQISKMASLSTINEQSECSRVVWVVKTEL